MQILYQTSPLSGVRAAVWAQEVETSPSVGTQKRRAVLMEKKHRLFQNPNAHFLLLYTALHQSHETVMKLKVNVQLASWATWNEFQGAHFFELKLRVPKGHALRGP